MYISTSSPITHMESSLLYLEDDDRSSEISRPLTDLEPWRGTHPSEDLDNEPQIYSSPERVIDKPASESSGAGRLVRKSRISLRSKGPPKPQKTEQLQRDSHDKAVQNSYLKDQVMRMKDEVQRMNAILLAHANCEGCRSSEGLQAHLSQLGVTSSTTNTWTTVSQTSSNILR
jgi:hypothetical protein